MRKILLLLLSVFVMQANAQQGACGKDARWKFDKTTSTLTVSGKGDMFNYGDPNYNYGEKPSWAPFKKQIKHVVIEDGITGVGEYAFAGLEGLQSVIAEGNSLRIIKRYAFANSKQLQTLTLSDSLSTIGFSAFENCVGLKDITIPVGVKEIGAYAFQYCNNIDTVYYNAFDAIGGGSVFYKNKNLKAVVFGEKVSGVPAGVFYEVSNLDTLINTDHIQYVGGGAFYGTQWQNNQPCDTLIYIGKAAYLYKQVQTENPKSIVLKEGTKSISSKAFADNEMLVGIEIPKSLDRIGEDAFNNCIGLGELVWNADSVGDFKKCPFSNSLYDVKMAEGVKHIPAYFLTYCSGLGQLDIPSTVRTIGTYAFYGCNGLNKLIIPESVDVVARKALSGCANLDTLVLNARICYDNLRELPKLKCVTFGKRMEALDFGFILDESKVLDEVRWNTPIEVESLTKPFTSAILYASFKKLVFGNEVRSVYPHFRDNYALKEIVWSDSLLSIDGASFTDCNSLERLTFPSTLKSIGNWAFSGCNNLAFVNLPDSLQTIGHSAFSSCDSLKSIYLPEALTSIGSSAFASTGITDFYIPQNVKSIGTNALVSKRIDKIVIGTDKLSSSDIDKLFNSYDVEISDSAKIYVPDTDLYKNIWKIRNHLVPLIVSDSANTHVYNGGMPVANFRGNLPGYNVVALEMPVFEVNAGKHKAMVKTTFVGDREFTINAVWNYEILKADQKIIWNKSLDKVGVGDSVLIATATSGLTVVVDELGWWTTNEVRKHADGTYWLHCNEADYITLTARQEGDNNWNKVSEFKDIKIYAVSAVDGVAADNVTVKCNSGMISVVGAKAGTTVMVYAANGSLIHRAIADAAGLNIAVAKGGLYVVKVHDRAFKVVVK